MTITDFQPKVNGNRLELPELNGNKSKREGILIADQHTQKAYTVVFKRGDTFAVNQKSLGSWLDRTNSNQSPLNLKDLAPEQLGELLTTRSIEVLNSNLPKLRPVVTKAAVVTETAKAPYSTTAKVVAAISAATLALGALAVYLNPTLLFEAEPAPITSLLEIGSWSDAQRYWNGE